MKRLCFLALGLCAVSSAAAQQESPQIEVADDATWHHQWTGLAAPPELSGFVREEIQQLVPNQLDNMALYFDRSTDSLAAIYVFRPGLADVSVWSDRAIQTLRAEPEMNSTGFADVIVSNFTPKSGGGENSGIIAYGTLVGGDGKSAGLALFPHDGWLVKIHMSSATDSRDELARRLVAFVSALEAPAATIEYPPAFDIGECRRPIDFASKPRRVRPDMTQLLLVSTMAPMLRRVTDEDGKPITPVPPSNFCRDPSSTSAYGVYRSDASTSSYIIAHGDAGLTVRVGKSGVAGLLGGRNDYWVMMSDAARTSIYAPFARLPDPEHVIATIRSEAPVTAAEDPPEGGTNIILSDDALGD